ncbi:MAG: hypothetical protein EP318_04655 [Rhodobacteraceae bacterium]|nr:MAG: hypothetical protein EP318_04655 [Paracoccaceae bacterium]
MTAALSARTWVSVAGLAALVACSPQSQDQLARGAAKSVVARAATERLPGVPVEPYTDCIIDNASSTQILALAADTVVGVTASSWEIITGIARKPATLECFLRAGMSGTIV